MVRDLHSTPSAGFRTSSLVQGDKSALHFTSVILMGRRGLAVLRRGAGDRALARSARSGGRSAGCAKHTTMNDVRIARITGALVSPASHCSRSSDCRSRAGGVA